MPRQRVAHAAHADQPRMARNAHPAVMDLDGGVVLVHRHRPAHQALGHGVSVHVNADEAVQIHHPIEHVVHRRQHGRQAPQMGLLHHVGGLGRHAQTALGLGVGHLDAPAQRLRVQVVEGGEAPSGQEARFQPSKRALDPTLAVRVVDAVGHELEAQASREGLHLRGDDGIRARSPGQHDAGVVDDASRCGAVHEPRGLHQEVLGLEAGEVRVILNEQASRVRQRQPRALCLEGLVGHLDAVR